MKTANWILAIVALLFAGESFAQIATCQQEHVAFTTDEHLRILIADRKAAHTYDDWDRVARSPQTDKDLWFNGKEKVSLAYVKSHMPRAVVFTTRFPVDKAPRINRKWLDQLLDSEQRYEDDAKKLRAIWDEVNTKYKVQRGPLYGYATVDENLGGIIMCKEEK